MINRLGAFGIKYIRFAGGEPLLRKDLFEVLDRADTSKFKNITLATNGLLLKRLYKEINDSPITKLTMSIDGLEETNDIVRGIKGYFKQGFEGLKLIQGKEIHVVTTLNKKSAGELGDFVDEVHSQGHEVDFNVLDNRSFFLQNADMDGLWPDLSDIEPILSVLKHKLGRPDYELRYLREYFTADAVGEPPCYLGFIELFIVSNGDLLSGCYVLPPMGNVLKQDLEEIVTSKSYRERCMAMLNRECPGCTCGILLSLKADNIVPFKTKRPKEPSPHRSIRAD